ncbi:MAG: ferredoxin, partial [Epsilonproteobacteria bacterium]|nr:ferredoxin [Campylobacterota bacterium]
KNVEPIAQLPEFNGTVIYRCEPVLQFSPFTNKAHQLQERGKLYASETFLQDLGLQEGDKVNIQKDDITIAAEVALDDKIGSGAYIGTFDPTLGSERLFDGYRFTQVTIQKV